MNVQVYVDGISRMWLDPQERGFHYGDGLFETMAVHKGSIPLWAYHWQRLLTGCERLKLPLPDQAVLEDKIARFIKDNEQAVLKLIVSRGNGERGYRIPATEAPTHALFLNPWPDYPDHYRQQGVRLKLCDTPLSMNPVLAGIKHLNRLEQIMARNEWQDDKFQEGVMLNTQGHVVEGTMSNLFWIKDEQLFTPDLSQCGVLGIMRQQILEKIQQLTLNVKVVTETVEPLLQADEVFITNSLIGVWPVQSIEDKIYEVGRITKQLQSLV